ncbi:MAG: 50S ribosomal protein L6, partial [Caldanaerobacter sp.]
MSRIGRLPIPIPKGVEVKVSPDNVVTVKGVKGTLEKKFPPI